MNTIRLRTTLASLLGKVLTPELAADIEMATYPEEGVGYSEHFEPITYNGYVIDVECMREIIGELHALHVMHWQETERHRHGLHLDPDYCSMLEDEQAGRLVQFTVRAGGGTLVGNLRVIVSGSRHTSTLVAEEDTLFLHPAHRGGFLASRLLAYAEDVLAKIGACEVRANSKLVNRADVLLRRRGYTPVATQMVKFLQPKEASHVQ